VSAEDIDWMRMMEWAEQQAIIGVIYGGIQKVGTALKIPFNDLMEWIGYAQQIEAQNRLLNQRCVEIAAEFQKDGFETCILKGQGNAMMYSNPLLRTPGDADVYLRRKGVIDIIKYVKKRNPGAKTTYNHVEYGEYKGVEVEAHYRPTFMNNLIANRKLQRWIDEHQDEQFQNHINLPDTDGCVSVPTWAFNVVFQLSHIYRHVIQSGIGLKPIIDYYYLLRSMPDNTGKVNQGDSPSDPRKRSIMGTVPADSLLRELGLEKIAEAMMWMLNEVLGLPEAYLIAPKDERRGRVLLAEVMKGGNFGFYDAENQKANSAIKRNIQRIKRDVRLVRYFPSECLWEPVFRGYHFFWRLAH
jgi:hypothetical protein